MPFQEDIQNEYNSLDEEFQAKRNPPQAKALVNPIPPEGTDEASKQAVAQFVTDIVLDSVDFERSYFARTEHIRPKIPGGRVFDSENWMKACESLSKGRNFDVWGSRSEEWMQERVDGEIPRSMHVRRDHITANWHEIELNPNTANIGDLFDQERRKMGWKDWVEEFVGTAQTYGTAYNEICVDYHIHPNGQVKNIVRKPRVDIVRTPEAKSFSKSDGCSYVVTLDSITDKQIEEEFEDVDASQLATVNDVGKSRYDRTKQPKSDYKRVKFYPKFRAFFDDETTEEIPFGQDEHSQMVDEMSQMLDGQPVQARADQHHVAHIMAKQEAVQNLMTVPPSDPEDEAMAQKIAAAHMDNIQQHISMMNQEQDLQSMGMRKKYPNGRYVCVIGTTAVRDMPNPYDIPWRMLFRELSNQRVIGRIDGEGDPEIMFSEAFQADMQLSRIEDLTILQMPQTYRPLADKGIPGEDQNDNSPRRVRYTNGQVYTVQGTPPATQLELYKISKANAEHDRGVNSVAYGDQPTAGSSGKLVALVQNQNQTVITGELDRNLREVLEDIVEGMFEVIKVIYNQDREYILNGKIQNINVAKLLGSLPKVEITVKPGSNYPNQWEKRLAFLVDMAGSMQDPAQKEAFNQAILNHLAIQYPDFAEGGKYRTIAQATQIGMQIIAQQQAQQAAQQKSQDAITNAMNSFDRNQLVKEYKTAVTGGGNGQGQ